MTSKVCELHHQLMESKLKLLEQKDNSLEEKIEGIEVRLNRMDEKLDELLALQANFNKYLLWMAVGIILTLIGVLTGRALDFGWVI